MLNKSSVFLAVIAVSCLLAGCAGPEQKLGRGIDNLAEIFRFGEVRRSIEQTASVWLARPIAHRWFLHGVDRSIERTCIGFYEVLTFPIPNHPPLDYGPIMRPADPVYPDTYKPNAGMSSSYSPTPRSVSVAETSRRIIPGSRFRIFDN